MTSTGAEQQRRKDGRMAILIWAGLLGSVVAYGVLGNLLRASAGASEAGPPRALVGALCAASLTTSGMAFVLPGLLAGAAPLQRSIVRWALIESVGVIGLVLSLLGASPLLCYGLFGWSLLLLLLFHPAAGVEEKQVAPLSGP